MDALEDLQREVESRAAAHEPIVNTLLSMRFDIKGDCISCVHKGKPYESYSDWFVKDLQALMHQEYPHLRNEIVRS